ncbi:MAG TPA: thioredoxin-like domain-containing protein [Pirellulaceae bacterium]|nr:thioredoxin-like domain-containing protein [Pirellulaceae bacterium]
MMFAARFRGSCATLFTSGACLIGLVSCSDYQASPPAAAVAQATEPDPRNADSGQSATDAQRQGTDSKLAAAEGDPPVTEVAAAGQEDDGKAAGETADEGSKGGEKEDPLQPANPFRRRIDIPELPGERDWINSKPLSKKDLRGKFVIFDFWTYCCINCMHVLPELKKLEKQFPHELVVIGVHSAKFDAEKDTENILAAVLRHEIEHPVFNDADHLFWDTLAVSSWPTIYLIDPEGKAVWGRSGEFKAAEVAEVLNLAIPYYRKQNLLDERPFVLELAAEKQAKTPLRFPGKVLADETGNRLFIADSSHNRIVISSLDGKLLDVIGSGAIGRSDGDYKTASFDHPQGMALHQDTLYVADTENHLLRKVDLKAKAVTTIAGLGLQARHPWPGLNEFGLENEIPTRFVGKPRATALNSPWDLWIHDGDLYIAMAGPHQIWKMPLDEAEIGPYAGNGREDVVDGPLLPRMPYATGYASFAQPSGLTSDGTWLYVADSEGSSIRAVPFDSTQEVKTVVGTAELPLGRLFAFGDEDGPRDKAKLQHCLGVAFAGGKLYVADTYNNKIKVVDPESGETRTLAGTGKPGCDDEAGSFDEPAGIAHAKGKLYIADTNNHLIRTIELASGKVATLAIEGLAPPAPKGEKKPAFKNAVQEKVSLATLRPSDGQVKLNVSLQVPEGWKINSLAPMSYWLDSTKETGPADRTKFGKRKLDKPVAEFEVPVSVSGTGDDEVRVSLNYYYCQGGDEGVCKTGSVVFTVPLKIAADGDNAAKLMHKIAE